MTVRSRLMIPVLLAAGLLAGCGTLPRTSPTPPPPAAAAGG